MTLISFLVLITFLILAHELGHFVTAKLLGVPVRELAVGVPPRLFSVHRGGTAYSLNAIPLGGYVRLAGEDDPTDPGGLAARPRWQRAIIIASGSLINLLLAVVLFSLIFTVPSEVEVGDVFVKEVAPGSPAHEAGLQPDDQILTIDDQAIRTPRDALYRVLLAQGSPMTVVILRNGSNLALSMVPRWDPPPGEGPTGFVSRLENPRIVRETLPLWQVPAQGLGRTRDTLVLVWNEITRWTIGASRPDLLGPIGIAQITGEVARAGPVPLLEWTALLSLNLGFLNLLPIPMLDGSKLFFVGVEALRGGRRISPRKEGMVHFVGLLFLMGVMIVVSYYDLLRLFVGETGAP